MPAGTGPVNCPKVLAGSPNGAYGERRVSLTIQRPRAADKPAAARVEPEQALNAARNANSRACAYLRPSIVAASQP